MSSHRAAAANPQDDSASAIVTKESPVSVADTVERCLAAIALKGLTLFAVIDHRGEAKAAGLTLRDTKLVIFGNPVGGTPIMTSAPLAALDLPLRVLIWGDGDTSKVSYTPPSELANRYGFSAELGSRLNVIHAIASSITER